MRTTLFYIPNEVLGLPLFGFGLLLAVFLIVSAAFMAWQVYQGGWRKELLAELPMMLVMAAMIVFVLPRVADEHGLPIRGYGAMVFLGLASGVALAAYRAVREGYPAELIYTLALLMTITAIIGARLFYVIEYWEDFRRGGLLETLGAIVNYTRGGLVVYGAFVAGAAAAIVFFIRNRLPILKFCDIIAPSLLLGLALGRLGCFLNGCCYGGQCDLPWAVQFPPGAPPYIDQANRGLLVQHGIRLQDGGESKAEIEAIEPNSPAEQSGLQAGDQIRAISITLPNEDRPIEFPKFQPENAKSLLSVEEVNLALMQIEKPGTSVVFDVFTADGAPARRVWNLAAEAPLQVSRPVHPAQIYSAINAFLIFLLLLAWYPFRRHEGEVTALMLTVYPVTRFLEEIIRVDEAPVFGTEFSISQNVSILVLAAAVAIWVYVLRGPKLQYA